MLCIACGLPLSKTDIKVYTLFDRVGYTDKRCRACITHGVGEVYRVSKKVLLETLKFLDTRRFSCKACLTKVKLRYRDPVHRNYCLRCTNSDGRVKRLYSEPIEEWPRMALLDIDTSPAPGSPEILEKQDQVSETRWEKEPTVRISAVELQDLIKRLGKKELSKTNSRNKQISKNVWRKK